MAGRPNAGKHQADESSQAGPTDWTSGNRAKLEMPPGRGLPALLHASVSSLVCKTADLISPSSKTCRWPRGSLLIRPTPRFFVELDKTLTRTTLSLTWAGAARQHDALTAGFYLLCHRADCPRQAHIRPSSSVFLTAHGLLITSN
ncbi:hypothetical protein MHUMG1_06167 [Metarhizium humberi]|uniref:Uncharacterized protein n=1 Tax=Metarhizium humberi TaxID=2596975 RepID=A0A9P8M7W7_9HYPO|nr:hypothetical protein MHUMG1_06167 [Metarhizium humberi]